MSTLSTSINRIIRNIAEYLLIHYYRWYTTYKYWSMLTRNYYDNGIKIFFTS